MPSRIWKKTKADWDALSNLKRIYIDVSGRARGYVEVEGEGGPLYYAGSAPHLTQYSTEREARRNPLQFGRDMIVTLPGEVACSVMSLHHIAGLGEKKYEVREFRPHLLNPVPTATISFEEQPDEEA